MRTKKPAKADLPTTENTTSPEPKRTRPSRAKAAVDERKTAEVIDLGNRAAAVADAMDAEIAKAVDAIETEPGELTVLPSGEDLHFENSTALYDRVRELEGQLDAANNRAAQAEAVTMEAMADIGNKKAVIEHLEAQVRERDDAIGRMKSALLGLNEKVDVLVSDAVDHRARISQLTERNIRLQQRGFFARLFNRAA